MGISALCKVSQLTTSICGPLATQAVGHRHFCLFVDRESVRGEKGRLKNAVWLQKNEA